MASVRAARAAAAAMLEVHRAGALEATVVGDVIPAAVVFVAVGHVAAVPPFGGDGTDPATGRAALRRLVAQHGVVVPAGVPADARARPPSLVNWDQLVPARYRHAAHKPGARDATTPMEPAVPALASA